MSHETNSKKELDEKHFHAGDIVRFRGATWTLVERSHIFPSQAWRAEDEDGGLGIVLEQAASLVLSSLVAKKAQADG